ncbi:MAG: efflux RND transporter periplasmic adaptor subunit [Bacteroidota bacterium]|jgi:membrane fusion protein (multidrug efflux system)
MKQINGFVAVLMLIYLQSCSSNQNTTNTAESANAFPVTEVYSSDITTQLEYVADIHSVQNVEIRARVEGYLERIYVDEGKRVSKGQPLFKINDEEYRAALNSAIADLKSAEAEKKTAEVELERVKLLVQKGVIAKTELDLAEAKLEIAAARIEQARAHQTAAEVKESNTLIRSPFNGIIDRIPFKLGSLISAGTLLTSISDVDAVNVYFNVSEIEYLDYFRVKNNDSLLNQLVELELADGSTFPSKGKIETMESEFEPGTGSLALRARFQNKDHLLKHGSTGKVRIKQLLKQARLVPQKSVLEIQDKYYVFLVDKNNVATMKSFTSAGRYTDYFIVHSGLNANDKIIYEGIQNVTEGSVIKPQPTRMADVYKLKAN